MKHVRIDIKFYNVDTFNKQIDVNFIDLDSEEVDLNYKVASLVFCHVWPSMAGYVPFYSQKVKDKKKAGQPYLKSN